jgi:hypothetical protein
LLQLHAACEHVRVTEEQGCLFIVKVSPRYSLDLRTQVFKQFSDVDFTVFVGICFS